MRFLNAIVRLWVALVAVGGGAALLAKRNLRRIDHPSASQISVVSIFDGTDLRSTATGFLGGEVWTIYGGTKLDLRRAEIDAVAHLKVTTILGGTEISLPDTWLVTSVDRTLAGGREISVPDAPALPGNAPRLMLETVTVLGGLRVVARPVLQTAEAG